MIIRLMAFTLQAKNIFLTYPQCPLPKEEVLSQLDHLFNTVLKRGLLKYMVAEELHNDGNSHIHCFLKLKKRCHIRNATVLDLEGPADETYHGNYQSARNATKVLRYCMKMGNFITNYHDLELPTNRVSDAMHQAIGKARANDVPAAMKIIETASPYTFLTQNQRIHSTLQSLRPTMNLSMDGSSLNFYKAMPTWDKSKTLIIHGDSGNGKSTLATLLLPKALFISHLDGLGNFMESQHEGIILDDMSFLHLPREAQIHLVDTAFPRQIHIRYKIVEIPRGTPKIITTNLTPAEVLNFNHDAIKRRTTSWQITKNKNGRSKIININAFHKSTTQPQQSRKGKEKVTENDVFTLDDIWQYS